MVCVFVFGSIFEQVSVVPVNFWLGAASVVGLENLGGFRVVLSLLSGRGSLVLIDLRLSHGWKKGMGVCLHEEIDHFLG